MTFPSSHLSGTILSLLSLLRFLQSSTEATPGLSTPLKKLERLFDDSLISRLCLAFMGRTWRLVHSLGTLILNVLDYPPIERSSGTPRKAIHEGYQEQVFCKNQSSLNIPLNVLYQLQTLTIIIFNRRTTRKFSTLNSLTNMYTILLYILHLIHFT
ncbi:uncharacterized protein LOC110715392 isoform X1 [Chenopodium quinoa]|uniref:uncharacterized protein LOC110715392 isoform X1 n=1 Tax=Chenopodium quinoa TaxID=63459 RepID=UPI000B79224B|nr:uncharacterized protein LOC110715392 isoform X1 [Chenopodium quinoa]